MDPKPVSCINCQAVTTNDGRTVWVCEQCGEPLFDEETVDAIQEMLRAVDARVDRLTVSLAVA